MDSDTGEAKKLPFYRAQSNPMVERGKMFINERRMRQIKGYSGTCNKMEFSVNRLNMTQQADSDAVSPDWK